MAIGNVELVRLGLEGFEREGPEALLAYADEAIVVGADGVLDTSTYRGHDGVLRWSRDWLEAWETFRMEATEIVPVGDHIVVALLHQVGTGKASGIEVEVDVAYLIEVHDGKVNKLILYSDPERALDVAREDASE
jgi:ketosteroid isomerase-like protein